MRKIVSLVLLVLGVLLLGAAAVVRFAVAPARAVLPSDTDTTRTYTGTAATLINPAALSGKGGSALLHDVPVTVTHHTKVLASKSGNALVSDVKAVSANGSPVASVDYRYAVNRTNLGEGNGYSNVIAQRGITFNWPVRTNKHNYTGWVSDTHTTVPLVYKGTAKRGGMTTYVFTATTTPAPITDKQVLAALPPGAPKSTLLQLAPQLNLPPATLAALAAALPSMPAMVPFHYTYQVSATYWVAPKSGIIVDLQQRDTRSLVLSVGGQSVPITPVMDYTFTDTPATLTAAVNDAKDKASGIDLVYTQLPLGLAIGGAVLLIAGGVLLALSGGSRRSEPGPGGSHERIEPLHTPGS